MASQYDPLCAYYFGKFCYVICGSLETIQVDRIGWDLGSILYFKLSIRLRLKSA